MRLFKEAQLKVIGGLSHLSNQYGFAADNVVSFEVVLANATTVVASAESNTDLFFAMKGGGNNFGTRNISLSIYSYVSC